jgi:hypothetical protein
VSPLLHAGQRVAASGIDVAQNGHSLTGAGLSGSLAWLYALMTREHERRQ